MSIKNTIFAVPDGLRNKTLYKKFIEMTDYMVCKGIDDFADVKNKYRDAEQLSDEVIAEVIKEYGFEYINNIVSLLQNIDTNILLNFISLLHLLKGHQDGLELVLKVLGFDFAIANWWEQSPQGEPHTYNMDVFFNLSQVTDPFAVLNEIRNFSENYVYPKLVTVNLVVDFELANVETCMAGFKDQSCDFEIVGCL